METEHSGLCSGKSAGTKKTMSTHHTKALRGESFHVAFTSDKLCWNIQHCVTDTVDGRNSTTWDVWNPVNNGTKVLINWCRISSINSSSHVLSSHYFLPTNPSIKLFVRGTGKPFRGTSSSAGVLGPSTSPFLVLMVVSPADCHVHTRRLIILFEEDVSVYSWWSLLFMRCFSVKELKHTTLGFGKDAFSGKSTTSWCPECTDERSLSWEWHLAWFVANVAQLARLKEKVEMKVPNAIWFSWRTNRYWVLSTGSRKERWLNTKK